MKLRYLIFALIFCPQLLAQEILCETVHIYSEQELEFTDVEKRLLCGDSEQAAYRHVPPYQAKFFMQGFLQSRGFLNPEFTYAEDRLEVKVGKATVVNRIQILPEDLLEAKASERELWKLFNLRVITPDLLNAMEGDLLNLIQRKAYACASLQTIVNSSDGTVIFQLSDLKRFMFGQVQQESNPQLLDQAFDRFYAFDQFDPFDIKLLQLTEKRLVRSGVVQASYFTETCSQDKQKLSLRHNFIFGPPRTVRFGAGVSSEAGPLVRAQWSHNRYKEMASQLDGSVQASFREQNLNFTTQNFFWPDAPRRSLITRIEMNKETQEGYEEFNVRLKSHPQWTQDLRGRFWQWSAGPTLQNGYFRINRDNAKEYYSALAMEGDLLSMSHDFEFYDFHPEDGNQFNLHFDMRHPSLGFEHSLLKIDFSSIILARLWKWGRGDAVGGVRFNLSTTSVSQQVNIDALPPSVKYYGGGSDDIRGFPLQSLPENQGRGALSKLTLKFELRKTHFYRPDLEGVMFYDAGIFGAQSWSLDPTLYQSPGVGIRWLSPIGLVQSFVSRGYSNNPFEQHKEIFYVGIGGSF